MPVRRPLWSLALLPLTLFASPAQEALPRSAEPDPEVVAAEGLLKGAGIGTDGPALVEYFRKRTPAPGDQERLARAAQRLGDDAFEVREAASRELIAAGRMALPFLRLAVTDPDLEVSRRAERCIEEIQAQPHLAAGEAAARLIAVRRPPGAAAVLLAYLPFADDEGVEEAVFAALPGVGLKEGRPDAAVRAAVRDAKPLRRAAAAAVLGLAAAAEDRKPLAELLQDPEPRVRFEAALAQARAGDRSAVPVLLGLLTDSPLALAWRAEEVLLRLAGEGAPLADLGSGEEAQRRKCRDAWEGWWKANAAGVDLARIREETPLLGLTLVTEYDGVEGGGRVAEYGKDWQIRWQVNGLQGVNDVQLLPGGRVLVAERNGGRVRECERGGKTVWEFAVNSPIACQRLPGGNTLIATFGELLEVAPDGKRVRTHTHPGGFRHAVRLRNGHILYVSSNGQVVELDNDWKQVKAITPENHGGGAGYWASVEPLPSGRYLVALGGAGKVVEIDGNGKIVWECSQPNCVFATRLRNGHTLISCFEQRLLVEVDRAGKEVAKHQVGGRPFTIRRY
jgi:hypothetical protein